MSRFFDLLASTFSLKALCSSRSRGTLHPLFSKWTIQKNDSKESFLSQQKSSGVSLISYSPRSQGRKLGRPQLRKGIRLLAASHWFWAHVIGIMWESIFKWEVNAYGQRGILRSDEDGYELKVRKTMSGLRGSLTSPSIIQAFIKWVLLPMFLSFLPPNSQVPKHQLVISPRSSHPKLHIHPRGTHQAFIIMKAFTITAALVALAGLSHAAPAPAPSLVPCSGCVHLFLNATFLGAGPDPPSYTETVTTNTGVFVICTSASTWDTHAFQFFGSYEILSSPC